jgi:FAD/FMN-containing dehydrogenase
MIMALQAFGRASRPSPVVVGASEAIERLKQQAVGVPTLLAYGNGSSYGDSCMNADGVVADMRSLNRIVAIDPSTGVAEVDAGVFLGDLIKAGETAGLFPPILPGTQFVTIGGAIANDIHGKNHHRRGSFGQCVEWFTLLRSDGVARRCSRTENAELFAATIGGMGLTGLILSAGIRLMPVGSSSVEERAQPFTTVQQYFEMAEQADDDNEYAVAWIDQLARGKNLGRGVLLTGNHAPGGGSTAGSTWRPRVPFQPPFAVLSGLAIGAFNAAYRWSKLRNAGPHLSPWQSFFCPLDGVRNWNRLYGPKGLFQHQSVIPFGAAAVAVPALLEASHRFGQASFLTVLKRFGAMRSPGLLSFPRAGYTLTLDFANRGVATLELLAELDRITVEAGGAVNPYKDARMSPQTFDASFVNWPVLEGFRDPVFASDFWRRTAFMLKAQNTTFAHAAE